jgi:hypothetical protein
MVQFGGLWAGADLLGGVASGSLALQAGGGSVGIGTSSSSE